MSPAALAFLLSILAAIPLPTKLPRQWVIDDAKLLAVHEVSDLERRIETIHRQLDVRLVIVTVATLDHEPPRQFVTRALSAWRPGKRSAFLFVLDGGRELHIEPSDELRPALHSAALEALCVQKVAPRFRITDRRGGLLAGLDGLADLVKTSAPPGTAKPVSLEPSLPLTPLAPLAPVSSSGFGTADGSSSAVAARVVAAVTLAASVLVVLAVRARGRARR